MNDDQNRNQPGPIRRGSFRKGAALSALILLPALSALVYWLASDPLSAQASFTEVLVLVLTFAGIPTLIIFGGIGKNLNRAASTSAIASASRGSLLGSVSGLALVILAAIPTAALPQTLAAAIVLGTGAAFSGSVTGALLGLWVGAAAPIRESGAHSEA